MAGFGSRLRPHTWSKPKQLLQLADQTLLDHVLDMLGTLPPALPRRYIFITGWHGDQIEAHMRLRHPRLPVEYVEQREMLGQSHAIWQARRLLAGPMLMVFADTLVETDLGFLADEKAGAVAWVREVPDPRKFGVARLDAHGRITRLIEKPAAVEDRLAIVGFYYFADSLALLDAIEEQLVRDVSLGGEYYLADAVNILLARGLVMRTEPVGAWLDAGKPETTLETNAWLLEHGRANFPGRREIDGITIDPPVYAPASASIEESVIGPRVSLGEGVRIRGSVIQNSIIEAGAEISGSRLRDSIVGRRAKVRGVNGIIQIGDDSVIEV
jgi:glucose-1-phosphate thymidylyltransferase